MNNLINDDQWLIQQYSQMGITTIAQIADTTEYKVKKRLKQLGIQLRTVSESLKLSFAGKKYSSLNTDYFKDIDSEEKAYWLGFLMADGNVREYRNNCYQVSFELAVSDQNSVYDFCKAIDYDGLVYQDEKRIRLIITNSCFAKNLMLHNIVPRKSFNKVYPCIKPEFNRFFILGYFDGDGSITLYKDKTKDHIQRARFHLVAGSYDFLVKIKQILETEANVRFNSKALRSMYSHNNMTEFDTACMPNIAKLYDYLYCNSTVPFMKRKKERFDLIMDYYITSPLLVKRYSPNCLETNRP